MEKTDKMSVPKTYIAHKLLLAVSFSAVMFMTWGPRSDLIGSLLARCACGAAVLLFIPGRYARIALPKKLRWWQFAVILCWSCLCFFSFRSSWIAMRRLASLIDSLRHWWGVLVTAAGLAGTACTLPVLWKAVDTVGSFVQGTEDALRDGKDCVFSVRVEQLRVPLIVMILLLQFYMMQHSILSGPSIRFSLSLYHYGLNLALFASVSLMLAAVLCRWRYALLASNVFFSIWGLANHYVFLFHSSPLYFSELVNTATALTVLPNYRFTLPEVPWSFAGVCVLSFILLRTLWLTEKKYPFRGWLRLPLRALFAAILFFPCYQVFLGPKALRIGGSTPTYYISKYGFVCMALSNIRQTLDPYVIPEGYSEELLPPAVPVSADTDAVRPDIILILNESFCDLNDYMTLNLDRDYLKPYFSVPNAFYGHAVSPSVGGGTNNSEYELLTVAPYYLLTAYAPFNYLNFSGIDCSVPLYLHELGYTSLAMHFYSATNYNRRSAYPAMGFDSALLGPTDSLPNESYGKRGYLDSSYYAVMNSIYSSEDEGGPPRFYYLLTFQNHGGYTQNPKEYDTVRVSAGLDKDRTEQLEEYVSSVALSGEAFSSLADFYSRSGRPVIICMVGDHAPSFINSLESNRGFSSAELQIARRTVPYVIWSNYGLDFSDCPETVSIFGLMPHILSSAGLPITQFYQSVLNLGESYPVLLNSGLYQDAQGNTGIYDISDDRYSPITDYLYMSYAGLKDPSGSHRLLFLPERSE